MNQPSTIKKLLGCLLLLVFAMGITPKIFLHDHLASHRDASLLINDVHADQIDKAGFRCNIDHLVVESPFTDQLCQVDLVFPISFPEQKGSFFYDYHLLNVVFHSLRGPPAQG